MGFIRETIRESWEAAIALFKDTTPERQDEAARWVIRHELEYLYKRTKSLEKLLGEPERLRNRKIAEQMAEEMHQRLVELRRNPPEKTLEEQASYDVWKAKLTPREACRHLKGAEVTRWGLDRFGGAKPGQHKDYNIGCHTFVDGRTKAWCLNGCGFVSWKGDENWAEAVRMMGDSTNIPSSSERFVK